MSVFFSEQNRQETKTCGYRAEQFCYYSPILACFAAVPFAESGVLYEPINT